MSKRAFLKDLKVENPCTEDWEKMAGNERVRFCSHCRLNVNNISEMTEAEALKLVKKSDGRLCVRYVRHPKTDAPVFADKLYQITRRTGITAGVLGASLAAATTLTYAQGNSMLSRKNSEEKPSIVRISKLDYFDPIDKDENSPSSDGKISGVITDPAGAVIPGAIVEITGKDFKRTVVSNNNGFYIIENLGEGNYEITVKAPGFKDSQSTNVEIPADNQTQTYNATLEIGEVITMGAIALIRRIENPLINAVLDGKVRNVRNLIAQGVDVNARDEGYYSKTALHVAVSENKLPIVRILLNSGADVNALDEDGETPLMMIEEETSDEIVKLLIRYGAKLDIQSKEGKRTALINAAMIDNFKAMKALIEAGADVNIVDADGDTALDLIENELIEQLLIAYGAKRDSEGNY